jgi:hypothetical protein
VSARGDSALVKAGPSSLARVESAQALDEARRRLAEARARVRGELDALHEALAPGRALRETVREVIRRHPVLTAGGALVVGYGLARLLFRRG